MEIKSCNRYFLLDIIVLRNKLHKGKLKCQTNTEKSLRWIRIGVKDAASALHFVLKMCLR